MAWSCFQGGFVPKADVKINRTAFLQPIPVPKLPSKAGISWKGIRSLSPWVAGGTKLSFFFFFFD